METTLPVFARSVDWDALFRDYPPPDVFENTVFQWPLDRIREMQTARFLRVVEAGWRNPFYHARWSAAGLQPGDVRSLDDITKLPPYTSDDIKTDQAEHPPFGTLQGLTREALGAQPHKVQASGGTTGKPRLNLLGAKEWALLGMTSARGIWLQGGRPGDVMQIPVTCSLATLGWGLYAGCHDYLGILPLTTGTGVVTPSRRQLELAFDLGTTIWMSFPEYLTHLPKVCREELGRDVRELGTKFISSFLGPDTEGTLRRGLEDSWGCPVYDQYGTNEMGEGATECRARDGLHLLEDTAYFEFLDTETGQNVPFGETGNIVVTLLWRETAPIIRYNLRDLGRMVSEARCSCGGTFRRMDHFLGRSDDMVKIRGVNIYPMACLPAVKSDARTTGEWICVAERQEEGGVLRDEMLVRVETQNGVGQPVDLHAHLERRLREDLGLKIRVELVPEGSLAPLTNVGREGKARRLLDKRHVRPS
jgi:phenylacetate-CoA ligase